LGEAARLLLGEEKVVIHGDLEDAATAADELGGDAELLLDLGRQTGGTGVVASTGAVLDGDVLLRHGRLLSGGHSTSPGGRALERGMKWRESVFGIYKVRPTAKAGQRTPEIFPRGWILAVALSIIEIVQHRCDHLKGGISGEACIPFSGCTAGGCKV
jgi:hypothetical protein